MDESNGEQFVHLLLGFRGPFLIHGWGKLRTFCEIRDCILKIRRRSSSAVWQVLWVFVSFSQHQGFTWYWTHGTEVWSLAVGDFLVFHRTWRLHVYLSNHVASLEFKAAGLCTWAGVTAPSSVTLGARSLWPLGNGALCAPYEGQPGTPLRGSTVTQMEHERSRDVTPSCFFSSRAESDYYCIAISTKKKYIMK